MIIYLDRNIDVIVFNTDDKEPYDDIWDTLALDTAYKIHVVLQYPKLCYKEKRKVRDDNLYDFLSLLVELNTHGRPIYVHLKEGTKLPKQIESFCYKGVTFVKEKNVKKYRFGNIYLRLTKKGYYHRVSKDAYDNPNKWVQTVFNV